MLTLPVCKRTLKNANFFFPGQTEYLSDLVKKKTGITRSEIMILSTTKPVDKGKNLIVGLVTTHISLKEIIKKINRPIVEKKITAFKRSLSNIWNIKLPRIGITSINPHAGEGGLIGDEEIRLIEPIIKDFRKKGVRIFGPLSSDSCFSKTKRMEFDGILCFYHDQGLIPVKTLDFENSINITGGLPFLRVSPDHGPAFDIANKNVASIESLVASFKFLERMI
jgi:4-hydroxythreonine-4-phosphate dehydrogenase